MSRPRPLATDAALYAGLLLFAAWPCPPSDDPRRGWPSLEWEARYRTLRRTLLVGPAPPAAEALAEVVDLQLQLRDIAASHQVHADIASQWEEAFAALGRTADLIQRRAES